MYHGVSLGPWTIIRTVLQSTGAVVARCTTGNVAFERKVSRTVNRNADILTSDFVGNQEAPLDKTQSTSFNFSTPSETKIFVGFCFPFFLWFWGFSSVVVLFVFWPSGSD